MSAAEAGDAAPRDPEERGVSQAPVAAEISPQTGMGRVELSVADLGRSISYYGQAIGLDVLGEAPGEARMGVGGRELLVLVEEPGAQPAGRSTGLYHFALLVPERSDLARWLAYAARERVALTGLSDHFVSEALYLRDPDGHGIEIYADRPREIWEGQVLERMTTLPLDVRDLLGVLGDPATEPFTGLAPGTIMGHVHLKVADVDATVAFYRDVLGFGLMAQLGPSAAFLGAGGYHHHLGANTWESAGARPAPAGVARLLRATIAVPDEDERDRVLARLEGAGHPVGTSDDGPTLEDPSGNPLVLAVA